MSRFVRRLLAATLGVFILAVPALAAPVRSLPRDGFGFPGSGDSQQQILQILRQGKGAIPTTPYGGVNIASDPVLAKLLYPDVVKNWFDGKVAGITLQTPAFTSNHGSDVQGQVGWNTTQEELLGFLNNLPKSNMRVQIVAEFAAKTSAGAVEQTFKLPLAVFSKPPVFDPADLKALGKPVVYLQAMIHGDEHSGGEAMLALAQKLATDELHVLDKISVVMIPRFNVDGAWRYTRGTNTANPVWGQPELPRGFDQNRDHTSFSSPITRTIHTVVNAYRPDVCIDCHEMGYGFNRESSGGTSLGYRDFYLFDLVTLIAHPANVPASVTALNRQLESGIAQDLRSRGLNWDYYFYGWDSRKISADVLSTDLSTLISGEVDVTTELMEGPPDEAMTDSALSLKPAVSMLFETRSPKVLPNYKTRVYAHLSALESVLRQVAQRPDTYRDTVAAARAAVAAQGAAPGAGNDLILWVRQKTVASPDQTVLSYNAAHTQVAPDTLKMNKSYRNDQLTPVKSVARPYAYILSGDMGAVAERLTCTGVTVRRLTQAASVPVEAYRIDEVVDDDNPALNMEHRGTDYFPWNGTITKVINGVTASSRTVTFPAGSYVVTLDQPSANPAALALEPLANRSLGNYWLTMNALGKSTAGFVPVTVGGEYPVYRCMSVLSLPAEALSVARPFLDGAAVASCLPLGSAELAPLNKTALGGKEVRFGYFFTAEATDQPGQKPAGFDLVLPKEGNGYTLETWYLYDWVQGTFVPATPVASASGARTVRVEGNALDASGRVLAVATGVIPTITHTPTPGHRSSGGCDAGAFPAVAVLLVLAPVAFLRRR